MAIDRSKILKQADGFVASGKTDRAIDEFLKLLDDKPSDLLMMNRIGDLYLQSGKVREALDMFKRAAMGYERDGFTPKAAAVLKKARRAAPDDADVASRLAEMFRQTNMTKEAIQIHIEMADQFTKKGLLKRALEEFAQVVELDPKNLKNKIKLADLYNKEGMKDRAAGIYLEVAEALAIEQMHAEANQILDRAKTMVSSPQVFLTQSRLCVIQKDLVGAAEHLREGLGTNPRSPDLLEALAEVELQSKNPTKALQALGEVPQLAEKALVLCERALKECVRTGLTDEGLQLFKPIGRDFARRGQGDAAAKTLQNAMQGSMNVEAWMQMADIAHQSGNKQERIDALRNALAGATSQGDEATAATAMTQLKGLGITDEQIAAPPQTFAFRGSPTASPTATGPISGETTEIDPVRRMQIQQLTREAEHLVRTRNMEKAQESYHKILELDPANLDAINRIADIIRASGKMTAVQVHYVKIAEKVAALGLRQMAVEMLDKAEALFPGSTRMYRRTLGLLDIQPTPPPVEASPVAPVALPVIALDDGFRQGPPSAPTQPPSDMDVLIALDQEGIQRPQSVTEDLSAIALGAGSFGDFPIPLGDEGPVEPPDVPDFEEILPPLPPEFEPVLPPSAEALPEDALPLDVFESSLNPAPAVEESAAEELAIAPLELNWSELEAPAPAEAEAIQAEDLEPLELEPLPFATSKPVPPAGMPTPIIPVAEPVSAEVNDELASLLSDIDFQMDYGSPEEAKIEIENALRDFPNHPELVSRLELADQALKRIGHAPKSLSQSDLDSSSTFFDLTDVLGDTLIDSGEGEEMHDATHVVEKVQSVDELFNAFRQGVEDQVKVDDYDTHYNLGIAYKEMMLLEPAMEEFKKAMRDPERTLECCSMLSICEQVQGNLDAAMDWLHQGIDAPGFPPEDAIGLRYDLGEILTQLGRGDEAKDQYHCVYDLDPDYREVAAKV